MTRESTMLKSRIATVLSCLALVAAFALNASAADHKVVAKGLDNPTGLAVQPGTGHVFIASHAGVHRLDPKSGKVTAEITGYPTEGSYGKGPKYAIGPLGLAFLDAEHLVVGGGSRPDGDEFVRVYKVGTEGKEQKETDAVKTLGPIKPSDDSIKGEGNFYGVAVVNGAIYITCNGDDTKGWVAKATSKDGKWGKLRLAIATKEATEVDAPGPIAASKNGKAVIVGQIGEVTVEGDSLLTFYSANGKMQRNLTTSLNDIAGIAWSGSGKLYATDFSWVDASKGALYRLMPGKKESTEAKSKKILDLDKPTAIAFGEDGTAYIAVFGTVGDDGKPAGSVIAVSGL
jgi:hypothetical protein